MAERIMLRLGDFDFEIATAAYQQYVARQGARWAEQERLGRYPALQFVGQAAPEITLNGVLYPGVLGAGSNTREVSITPLRSLMAAGKPLPMVSGLGDVCGQWVVTDVSDTRTVFLDNGEARKIEFSVSLKYYGPDAAGSPGPASYGQTATGQTPTAGNTPGCTFPENMGDLIAAIPPVSASSPLAAISAVADSVGTVVQTSTTAARAVVADVTSLASEIVNDAERIIPQPVLGVVQGMARGAETIVTLGGFVGDTLSAITAMRYAGQADPNATLTSLHRGMTHIADSTRLIGHSVTAGMDILERTAATWDAVNGLSDAPESSSSVADLCRRAIGIAENLTGLCLRTDTYASALRDKIQVEGGELTPEDEDARRERIFAALTDGKDKIIRCLPEIANAEYGRANDRDKIGWAYFHDLITKWLHGRAYAIKDKYDNGGQEPYFVDWDWLMRFNRFSEATEKLIKENNLFSPDALANLNRLLAEDGAFKNGGQSFDYINIPAEQQRQRAIQGEPLSFKLFETVVENHPTKPDGLQAVVAQTTIYALAAGYTQMDSNGNKSVTINKIAFFIHDGFDFNGDQWLGGWSCTEKDTSFSLSDIWLYNDDFRTFRQRTGYGCDFRTMSIPEVVWTGKFEYAIK